MIRVPIVIPNYNKAKYLKECLDSIRLQTVPVEMFFYDDGSTDDSLEIVKQYKKYHMCNIHIYGYPQNRGVAHVVNRLKEIVEKAGNKYFCIVASDDITKPTFLEKLTSVIEEDTGFVTCHAQVYGIEDKVFYSTPELTLEEYRNDSKLLTAGIYSIDMWNELGGRREDWRLTHDYEFFVRMLKNKYPYKVVDDVLYLWRNYDGQLSRQPIDSRWTREEAYRVNNL